MGKNKKIQLTMFLLFLSVFTAGYVFACGGGGGGGGGGIETFNVEVTAQEQLVVENVNTESTDPMPITIAIDGEGPTEADRARTIRNMTAVVETLPWVGCAAITMATAELSIPVSIVIGMTYAYGTSRLSGGSEDNSRGDAVISGMAGGVPGGPVAQIIAGEVIKEMYANSPRSTSGPTMGPRTGAELNSNTGQVLQR